MLAARIADSHQAVQASPELRRQATPRGPGRNASLPVSRGQIDGGPVWRPHTISCKLSYDDRATLPRRVRMRVIFVIIEPEPSAAPGYNPWAAHRRDRPLSSGPGRCFGQGCACRWCSIAPPSILMPAPQVRYRANSQDTAMSSASACPPGWLDRPIPRSLHQPDNAGHPGNASASSTKSAKGSMSVARPPRTVRRAPDAFARDSSSHANGNSIFATVPPSSRGASEKRPPCARTMRIVRARPNPTPSQHLL